jgi:hypothetical protein
MKGKKNREEGDCLVMLMKKGQEEEENDSRNIKEKEKEIAKFIRKESIYLVNFTAAPPTCTHEFEELKSKSNAMCQ